MSTREGETLGLPLGRVGITLAALFVFRLGLMVPLSGIDQAAVAAMMRTNWFALERVSLFTLGMVPLLSVYLLGETLRLVSPGFARWQAVPANDRRLQRGLRLLALALAALQAWGIAGALESIDRLVAAPGWQFRIGVVVSLVAATAVLSWLADLVTRHGLCNGFWLLAVAPTVAGMLPSAVDTLERLRLGAMSIEAVLAVVAYLVLSTALLVGLDRARHDETGLAPPVGIWPPFLAYTAIGWLAAPGFRAAAEGADGSRWLDPGKPAYIVVVGLFVATFALRHGVLATRREQATIGGTRENHGSTGPIITSKPAPSAAALAEPSQRRIGLRLAAIAALAQVAICVAGEMVMPASSLAVPGMWLIAIVLVALRVLDGIRGA